MSEPRNYLEEATEFIGASEPLTKLFKKKREEVISNLTSALNVEEGFMGPTVRKAAAYALGQIGDSETKDHLKTRLQIEPASGVRDAIKASITAINLASDKSGHSQLERRKIIEEVYNGKRQANLS